MLTQRSTVIHSRGEGTWLSFHGIPSRIVATGKETGEVYCVSVGTSYPGGSAPPHSHTFEEAFYITKGTMEFHAGNATTSVSAGGFIHIPGGIAHFPRNPTDAESELITICAPAGFDSFQLEVGERVNSGDGPFPKADAKVEKKMKKAAFRYGINLSPDEAAFEIEPDIVVRQPGEGPVIGVVGDVYRFLVTGEESDGAYAIWHATIYPGGGPPPHRHSREEEFFYLLSGEVTIYDDDRAVTAKPGTAVNLPIGSRHWFKNESDAPAEMLIMVAPAGLEKMFEEAGERWTVDQGAPGEPTREDIARLKEVAPAYGIELG
ncbi:MAG: cupin domain-containing protein [Verrucomicrobiota bacterium]